MTIEWLEEQLNMALDRNDELDLEIGRLGAAIEKLILRIDELKDIISELLPMNKDGECINGPGCKRSFSGFTTHLDGSLCLRHPYYDRAREVLEIGSGAQE